MKATSFDSMIVTSSRMGQARTYSSTNLVDRSQLKSYELEREPRAKKEVILETIKSIIRFRRKKTLS